MDKLRNYRKLILRIRNIHSLLKGSVFLKNDIHSTYLPEIDFVSNNLVGNLSLDVNDTTDPTIQRLDWTYSILADDS